MDLPLSEIVESGVAMRFVDKTRIEYTQLRDSMHLDKQLIPICVRLRADGKHEIIDGLQRYAAAKDLGWKFIRVEVRDVTDDEALLQSIKMNSLSIEPKPLDYAAQIRALLCRNPGWSIGTLAGKLNQPTGWVLKQLDLLKLHPKIQADVNGGRICLQSAWLLSNAPKTWHLEYREDAMILTADEFREKLIPQLKQWRKRILSGKQKMEIEEFQPIASVRSMKILRAALDKPSVADRMVVENNCETLADAFRLGIAWAMNLDPVSAQAQRVVAQRKHETLLRLEARRRRERSRKAGQPEPIDPNSIS